MPKYIVSRSIYYEIEVTAEDEIEAKNLALETPLDYWREDFKEKVKVNKSITETETGKP